MKKKYLWRLAVIVLIIVGFLLGDVKIELGTYSPQAKIKTKTVAKQLENLQNIQGSFFRSPGESLDKELTTFKNAKRSLDLRTYF